ncbi:ribosomal L7/L12-like protein [Stackebrandtia endophytica]|uniref:Ribosomal L7/L12-like protein n=1 Tax=Stackebrandtia endophytica TaxID=1496996 RepID=A0A543AYV3_9ACTN|nr:hypothetical protein [Stackebrandtia endophytica]TQL77759.1 ribosomal L7/L12-like protein [Stackebrandtia endophytica]
MTSNFELEHRVARLEQLVEGLYRHLDLPLPQQQYDPLTPVRELALAGKTIPAIKLYREITRTGLKEAKLAVEAMTR